MNHLEEKIEDQNMVLKKDKQKSITKLINNLTSAGKKISREKDIFSVIKVIKRKKKINGLNFFQTTIMKIAPLVFLKKKKVGGGTFRIPVYLYSFKSYNFGIKSLVKITCGRKAGAVKFNMIQECRSICKNRGKTLNKKEKLYQQALANRAFIKFL